MFGAGEKCLVFRKAVNFMLLDCVLQRIMFCNGAYEPCKNLRKQLVPLRGKPEGRS